MARKRPIRVGVIGVGRGRSFASAAGAAGMELVALCDTWKEHLQDAGKQYRVATYTNYDRFLEHDMDAVVLANYFHQHAPFAIKALRAGKHVMSETAACTTLAQAAALAREVQASGKIYMFAENYPFVAQIQEMRRVYHTGEIGQATYAEGEYNHPVDEHTRCVLSPGRLHWRNWLPSTYYCTHALAPLMYITDAMPVSVNALSIARADQEKDSARMADPGSVILCRMDNGAVFRLFGLLLPGHSVWYRVHGWHGAMETERGQGYWGPGRVRVWHDEWDRQGQVADRWYHPDFPEYAEQARAAGHGGGDFWTNFHFANAIRAGKQPYFDVYRGLAMSVVGILAWKSALANGAAFDVPDFRKEKARQACQDDHWSPWPENAGPGQPPPSIRGFLKPSQAAWAYARKVWKGMGHKDPA